MCALFWIPAKDAAVPNLLRRPDQIETANQLALVMTYGVSVITASGLFALLSRGRRDPAGRVRARHRVRRRCSSRAAYLVTALTVLAAASREISGRVRRSGVPPRPGCSR